MLTMKDIIREGHPTLREKANEVSIPLSPDDLNLGNQMLEFLMNSQNEELAKKYELRSGVGLAAPQLNIHKRIIALLIPSYDEEITEPTLKEVMYNPKVISHSIQQACLSDGEGCLSVDRDVPGYVVRNLRITVSYINMNGEAVKRKFKGYEAIVVQHEIDHLNGIMFYDHINNEQPFNLPEGTTVI